MPDIVLNIDTTTEPCEVVVSKVDQGKIEVLESYQFEDPSVFFLQHSNDLPSENSDGTTNEPHAPSPFQTLLSQIKAPWSKCILLIPPTDYLGLNLDLPFNDPKKINRIIELEVQDIVPFETDGFVMTPKPVGQVGPSLFDVHVGLIPRDSLKTILANCKKLGIEPLILTPASSILGAFRSLAPSYFVSNAAIVWAKHPNFFISLIVDGKIRAERVLSSPVKLHDGNDTTNFIQDLKLSITASERKYNCSIEKVYLASDSFSAKEIQSELGRNTESISPDEFVKGGLQNLGLAGISGIFAADITDSSLLANFRIGEFGYRPQIRELVLGLKALIPYVFASLGAALLTILTIFYVRDNKIDRLQESMRNRIRSTGLSEMPPDGAEVKFLQGKISQTEEMLRQLGSLSKFSPLDLFLEVSKTIPPPSSGITVTSINIKDNKVKIKSTVPDLQPIDLMEKAFKDRRELFCDVSVRDPTASGIGSTKYSFEITLTTCE